MEKFIVSRITIRNLRPVVAFARNQLFLSQVNRRPYELLLWIEVFMLIVISAKIVICNSHPKPTDTGASPWMAIFYAKVATPSEFKLYPRHKLAPQIDSSSLLLSLILYTRVKNGENESTRNKKSNEIS